MSDTIEFVTVGGITVTETWANAQTGTLADAAAYLPSADEDVRRGYFPEIAAREAAFIRAKYPELA